MKRCFGLLMLLLSAWTNAAQHEINMNVSRDIAPGPKIRIQVNTKNLPTVKFTLFKVDPLKWLSRRDINGRRPQAVGGPVMQWDLTVAQKGQRQLAPPQDTYYSKQFNLPPLPPGVYMLTAGADHASAWGVVNVTNLAVVTKRSPRHILTWVTDFKTGKVISGAKVMLFNREGKLLTTMETGPDGAVLAKRSPESEALVVQKGKDYAGMPSQGEDPDGRLVAHFQTDRPIYRPGQKIYFKAILRRTLGLTYRALTDKIVTAEFRDPKNILLDQKTLRSNDLGSVGSDFDIPEEGATGPYSILMHVDKDTIYETVTCAAYRKPEYKIDIKSSARRYLAGETASFELQADYYFGAPVPQAQVQYIIRRSTMSFWGSDSYDEYFYGGDGNLYPRDTYQQNEAVAQETVHTDDKGHVVIEFKTDPKQPDSNYTIEATVTDGSGRQVQGSGALPVYAAALRIGLMSPVSFVPLGRLIPINVAVTDLDGKPHAADVTLVERHPVWDQKQGKYTYKELERTTVKIGPSGKGNFNLPAKAEGEVTIEGSAPDGTGRTARGAMGFYVAGLFSKPEQQIQQPQIGIRLDKRIYAPGDTAEAYATTNKPGPPLLMVLEGEDIWSYTVTKTKIRSFLWSQKLTTEMSPNAHVSVAQWVDGGLMAGGMPVPIPDPARALKVQVVPDKKEYRPGDQASYKVTTFDWKNRPVQAEVALSVIDEAIYALQPDNTADPYTLYWGLRENKVITFSSAPEEVSGGAYQRVSTVAPIRQRFEDTAYWNAFVRTGPDGTTTVSFEMPGNLTTWRATGRGFTLQTSVGIAYASVVATRPVTLRLATPRQMVQGDRLTLVGTVNNRTDKDREFKVTLDTDGLTMSGARSQVFTVLAKSEGHIQWDLAANDLPEKPAELTGQIIDTSEPNNAEFADALRVSVPILPPGIQQRVLLGGSLSRDYSTDFNLDSDKIEPASKISLRVWSGLGPLFEEASNEVLGSYRYSTEVAADQLEIAGWKKLPSVSHDVRESLARISTNENGDGWGWWESSPTDLYLTSEVAYALGVAARNGIKVPDQLTKVAQGAVRSWFDRTNLWEYKALLAASATFAGRPDAPTMLDEVIRRGSKLSPFAKLRMAEALVALNSTDKAIALIDDIRPLISDGPSGAYLPTGFGIEWRASDIETTAEALKVFSDLKLEPQLCSRMAQWLATDTHHWRSLADDTAIVRAIAAYRRDHPDASRLGDVTVTLNGVEIKAERDKVGESATAQLPRAALKPGANALSIKRSEGGDAFFQLDGRIFRPLKDENHSGMRVVRRYEVRNPAGVWEELNRPLGQNEPVRVTVTVWGDSIEDGVRVIEPLPAGFEFIDEEYTGAARQEVRDAAVVHYVMSNGTPMLFRYYIRGESEGTLTALPATAEVLRRPDVRGRSSTIELKLVKQKP